MPELGFFPEQTGKIAVRGSEDWTWLS